MKEGSNGIVCKREGLTHWGEALVCPRWWYECYGPRSRHAPEGLHAVPNCIGVGHVHVHVRACMCIHVCACGEKENKIIQEPWFSPPSSPHWQWC